MSEPDKNKYFVDRLHPYVIKHRGYISGLAAYKEAKDAGQDFNADIVYLSAFTPKQAVWKLLLKPDFQSDVFIMDNSLGAVPIELSKSYRRIIVYQPYKKAAEIIECRIAEAGADNVHVIDRVDIKQLEDQRYRFGVSIFLVYNNIVESFGKTFLKKKIDELIGLLAGLREDQHTVFIVYPKKNYLHLKKKILSFWYKNGFGNSYFSLLKRRHNIEHCHRYSLRGSSQQHVSEVDLINNKNLNLDILKGFQNGNILDRIKNIILSMPFAWPLQLIALSDEKKPSLWLYDLVDDISSKLGKDISLSVKKYFAGNPFMILLELESSSKNRMICRLPLGRKISIERAKRNYDTLELLQNDEKMKGIIPKPLCCGNHHGQPYYVERLLEGNQQELSKKNFKVLYHAIRPVLFYFHQVLGCTVKIDSTVFNHIVGSDLSLMSTNARTGGDREDISILHENLRKRLLNKSMTLPFLHGDFKIENMLFSGSELSGIFDWDLSSHMGFPYIDLFYFYGYSFHYLPEQKSRFIENFIVEELIKKNYPPILKDCVDEYSEHLGIADEFKDISGIIYWIHYIIRTTSVGFSNFSENEYVINFRRPLSLILKCLAGGN